MLKKNKFAFAGVAVVVLAAGPWVGSALAVIDPPSPVSLARGGSEAKRLLFIMDKDKNGKVSKQEFMNFMEAEFDRLDKDKSGELDLHELTPPHVGGRPSR
jgi:hypothetical protein